MHTMTPIFPELSGKQNLSPWKPEAENVPKYLWQKLSVERALYLRMDQHIFLLFLHLYKIVQSIGIPNSTEEQSCEL